MWHLESPATTATTNANRSEKPDSGVPVGNGSCIGLPPGKLTILNSKIIRVQCQTSIWEVKKKITKRLDGNVTTTAMVMEQSVNQFVDLELSQLVLTMFAFVIRRTNVNGRDISRTIVNVRISSFTDRLKI